MPRPAPRCCSHPRVWPWALGAVGANHLVLTGGALWPRSRWLGRNWTRLPEAAAARREIAITIDDGPDPEVTPARARPARCAPGARDLLRDRLGRRAPSRAVPRDRAPRPQRAEPQRSPFARVLPARTARAEARDRVGAGAARRPGRRGAALLPRARRPAQSLARTGAPTARPGAGELDPARLRHGPHASRGACWRGSATDWMPATSCSSTTATRRGPRPASRWCSPSCRRCSSARRRAGLRPTTLADALPAPDRTAAEPLAAASR